MADMDWGNILQGILDGGSRAGGVLSGIGSAISGYNQANKDEQLGRAAADRADPFGSRDFYRDRLRQSYDDPSAILNDPGHQISVNRGLDAVQRQNAAQGYLGSGRMLQELSKFASDTDATYLDQERKQLGNLAGAQFDPANAGKLLMQGGLAAGQERGKALDALNTGLNFKPPGKKPNGDELVTALNGLSSPAEIAATIAKFGSLAGGTVKDVWNYVMQHPNISDNTKELLTEIGQDPTKFNPNPGTDSGWGTTITPDDAAGQWQVDPTKGVFGGNSTSTGFGPGNLWTGQGIVDTGNYNMPDWGDPQNINWTTVNYSKFQPSDWSAFDKFFGVAGEGE